MRSQSRIQRSKPVLASVVMVFAALSLRAMLAPDKRVAERVPNAIEPSAGAQGAPSITYVKLKGKKLTVRGFNFGDGAVIWVDGVEQKTESDVDNVASVLIAKKAGKHIQRESIARLWVQNPDGLVSEELSFYTGCGSQ